MLSIRNFRINSEDLLRSSILGKFDRVRIIIQLLNNLCREIKAFKESFSVVLIILVSYKLKLLATS